MKTYKKVELVAKNTPKGSYVAGCPSKDRGTHNDPMFILCDGKTDNCVNCERTH